MSEFSLNMTWFLNIFRMNNNKNSIILDKQAGAELCQAQEKLGLDIEVAFHLPKSLGCLPFTNKLRSPSFYLEIEVVFHLPYS